jgi:hypothetical protein
MIKMSRKLPFLKREIEEKLDEVVSEMRIRGESFIKRNSRKIKSKFINPNF